MPVPGFDDFLGEDISHPNTSALQRLGVEDIAEAMTSAYVTTVLDRESRGDLYRGFTRKDYESSRREHDPTCWQIQHAMGSWSRAMRLLPSRGYTSKQRFKMDNAPEEFYRILCDVAKVNGVDTRKVTARMYTENARATPGVPDWRTFASRFLGAEKWSTLVDQVCDIAST